MSARDLVETSAHAFMRPDGVASPMLAAARPALLLLMVPLLVASWAPVAGAQGGGGDGGGGDGGDAALPPAAQGRLVQGVEQHAMAVVDGVAYVIGGRSCWAFASCSYLDTIQRFDPRTGETTTMGATLPEPRYGAMAVAYEGSIYVLGGMNHRFIAPVDTVFRYDVAADTVETLPVRLPLTLGQASVATIGREAYLIGGGEEYGTSDAILVFDMAAHTFRLAQAKLPTSHHVGAAVTDGRVVYVFGGLDGTYDAVWAQQDAIWRYDPQADTLEVMRARLTGPLVGVSAVWDGSHAYVFGGKTKGADGGVVRRYDPVSDTLTPMDTVITPGRSHAVAFWDGDAAYLLGGRMRDDVSTDAITRYDAASDTPPAPRTSTPRPAAPAAPGVPAWLREPHALQDLPVARVGAAVARAGDVAYLVGGLDADRNPTDTVVRVDLATGASRVMDARLPAPLVSAGAFWDGRHVYVIGGVGADGNALADILRFDPTRGAVATLDVRLPVADAGDVRHSGANVGWDGRHAYVLGGTYAEEILRFDPARGTLTTMRARLPQAIADPAVGWDGEAFYLFGGWAPYEDAYVDLVVRYDPVADEARVLFGAPVGARLGASVVHDGEAFYVFGGWHPEGTRDDVLQFHPASGKVRTLEERLPAPRAYAATAWTGRAAVLLGGDDADGPTAGILRLGPSGTTKAPAGGGTSRAGDEDAATPGPGALAGLAALAAAAVLLRRGRRHG